MKYLKTFEKFGQFDLGRFSEEDETQDFMNNPQETKDAEDVHHEREYDLEDKDDGYRREEEEEFEGENEGRPSRVWGDEVVEKKKINAGFQAYLDKKAGKKADKKEDKEEKGGKKAKPDFLDLDKDGDKKETMKKAAKDAKGGKQEEKGGKGLTAAQKKLPAGLQKAIAAKKK
jgi:hypothetical protein